MAKKIWDGDYDINTDWGGKDTDGQPLSGEMVQDVIKTEFKRLENNKVGYIGEHGGTVYFSSNKESYDNESYLGSVASQQRYSMELKTDPNNRKVFLSSESNKKITWYFKSIQLSDKSTYEEGASVEYHIQNITEGTSKTVSTTLNYRKDTEDGFRAEDIYLDDYLTNGISNIEIVVKGLRTKEERTINQEITIVTLNLEDTTDFSKPFNNNIIVNTKVNCTIGQEFYYEYRFNDTGEFIFDNVAYKGEGYSFPYEKYIDFSHLENGKNVLEYRLFINLGGEAIYYTSIQRIEFIKGSDCVFDEPQVLIFSRYDKGQDSIATDGNLIVNGVTQYVAYDVKYAVYNSNVSTTNIEFYDITDGNISSPITTTVNNGTFYYYSVQSMTNTDKVIKVVCKDIDGNVYDEDGRIVYVNVESSNLKISEFNTRLRIDFSSVGKSNNSELDKTVWVSNVPERGFTNQATFNETFDWSQGWTENGLVISNGCEVVFDYTPFPQQKEDPSTEEANEYIGGEKPYTFEIEFMTQNVTDETAVLCDMVNERGNNNCGLLITGSEIKFTTPGNASVSTRFKEGEMNRVAIVVHPETTDKGFKGLVELYINGVMSSIAKYDDSHKFEVFERDENGGLSSKKLRFKGADGADLVVKYIRAYNSVMKPDDAVNNYIIYRTNSSEMLELYNANSIINEQGLITPDSVLAWGKIPFMIFVGRTVQDDIATGDGNTNGYDGDPTIFPGGYIPGQRNDANEDNWYGTLEKTTDKKKNIDMDVIYYNPLDKTKNFKFVKAYITPQGTSSMYYPKKNYRIYTQKNDDTRMFLSQGKDKVLELKDMLESQFGEDAKDREFEVFRGVKNKKKRVYSFKDNAQAVKCWCLKADFAETSSSHNTGIARLWGDTLKKATVSIGNSEYPVFKTTAQSTIENLYKLDSENMPDIRTTIDGFPILVFGKRSYNGRTVDGKHVDDPFVFLGKYNFNNDKSTESVFGFCKIDNNKDHAITDDAYNYETNESSKYKHTLDEQLDQYMTCVETLDNGNALANFSSMVQVDESGNTVSWDDSWEDAFEFRYPEMPEAPEEKDYKDGDVFDKEKYDADVKEFKEVTLPYWKNTHLKPFKHFAEWIYSTRWCDANGEILTEALKPIADAGTEVDESGNTLHTVEEVAEYRKRRFAAEKWDHLDVWKVAAYYIYTQRFGAVDQMVKNSMLTAEGTFAYNSDGSKYGVWDSTDVTSPLYGRYYKWYYINYDNDTIMGVKNDGSLKYGPEITRQDLEGEGSNRTPIYAGYTSTLWNNIEQDAEFQNIIKIADKGISRTMTYSKTIEMFDVEQVGKWCERVYNRDAEYKYISPYLGGWSYKEQGGTDENAENFADKLFMLQGSRTAHRRWWLSRRFNLLDGRWSSGDFASKFIEVKCDYGTIGDTFTAVAGANAYFGYQINNKTFGYGAKDGGTTYEYKANDEINWKLYKVINIGDPIAIYGSNDLLELNLQGLSKNLSSIAFNFGSNSDLGNKMERLILSLKDEDLLANSSYVTYADDEVGTAGRQSGFEKLQAAYPFDITDESIFTDGTYPTVAEPFNANDSNSPKFYRIIVVDDKGNTTYTYFAKVVGGVRNRACNTISLGVLNKLQVFKMAGYASVTDLNLSENKFISEVDVRYSGVNTINFGDGSRIKDLKVSSSFTTLNLLNSDNLKLSNIWVDSTTLKNDGGQNITEISVTNSAGLNHSLDFKNFIIKWMKMGDVSTKKLVLRGVRWAGVKMSDIDTIIEFLIGNEEGKKALECVITGVIEMGNEKINGDDIEKFNYLVKELGGSLTIRIPYANIILSKEKTEIIAGESAKYSYTLYPDADTIISNGGVVEYSFVKEVSENDDFDFKDSRTNKYYKKANGDDVRSGLTLTKGAKDTEVIVNTIENVVGGDTNALLMVSLYYGGDIKFDIANLLIKEPTYAVEGNIAGMKNIGDKETSYEYNLSILSNTNEEPIGTIDIKWDIEGSGVSVYFKDFKISDDKKTYTITTSTQQPYPTGDVTLTAKITNHEASESVIPQIPREVIVTKKLLLIDEKVVLTEETNPVVFAICKEQGWAKESPIVMTRSEAEAVTDIGTAFANIKAESGWTFDEFMYFTNVKLTTLKNGAFANSDIKSIVLPQNITSIGDGAFENCKQLKSVDLNENISIIPNSCFLNCESLVNFMLPDSVTNINEFAFGGTNMKRIIDKNLPIVEDNKAILLSIDSNLTWIENNAFEIEPWTVSGSTNVLEEITIPKQLRFRESSYNFTLSTQLYKVTMMDDFDSYITVRDNIIYANRGETTLVRAIPRTKDDNFIVVCEPENTTDVYPYAFFGCKTIQTIVFSDGIVEYGIGKGAFYGSSIKTIDLSSCNQLVGILEETFTDCDNLIEVLLPLDGNLTVLHANSFNNCMMLTSIKLPDTITEFKGIGGGNDANTFTKCGFEEIVLPSALTLTGRYFINNCPNLRKVVFPDFYVSMGSGGMDKITECSALEEIHLPIFSYTNELGENIVVNNYLENNATPFPKCNNIQRFVLSKLDNGKTYTSINGVLYKIGSVDESTGEVILIDKELSVVPNGLTEFVIDKDTKVIGSCSFRGCDNLKSVNIPDGVVEIKPNAFTVSNPGSATASKVEEIILPASLKTIHENAFEYCMSLKKIVIPEGVTDISRAAFRWCTGLEEVVMLGDITHIGQFAFAWCTRIKKIVLLAQYAPAVDYSEENGVFMYHPFGYNNASYTGFAIKDENKVIYLPYDNIGYDSDDWMDPLQMEDKCNFKIENYELDQECVITAINASGDVITDGTLYFVSESGDLVFSSTNEAMSATYNVGKGGFVVNFNSKTYHNETIKVYTDSELTQYIGSFVARYGVNTYEVKEIVMSYSSRGIFSSGFFSTPKQETNKGDEIVNITKREYDMLMSRINQLTEIIDKLK